MYDYVLRKDKKETQLLFGKISKGNEGEGETTLFKNIWPIMTVCSFTLN